MIEIRLLAQTSVDLGEILSRIAHYTSSARYHVQKSESDASTTFTLELVTLDVPYIKRYEPHDADTMQMYQHCARNEFSLGAFDAGDLIGIALVEHHSWNGTLWIWEFHLAESYRGKGIGAQLMNALAQRAKQTGIRALCCETQNTNVPAIRFYRRVGFTLDGLNISLYSNEDYPNGEIALFLKRNLQD